jgi:hypothetical protein
MKVSKKETLRIGKRLKVNFDIIPVELLQHGINIEMEHAGGRTNVIGCSFYKAGKIALAHLSEFIDYYYELEKMEEKLKKKHKGKRKPKIFLD